MGWITAAVETVGSAYTRARTLIAPRTGGQVGTPGGEIGDAGFSYSDERAKKIAKYKAMRRHPIVALGLWAIEGPLRSATWRVECPDDPERAARHQDMLGVFWLRFHRMAVKSVPFGFAPFEIEYAIEPGANGVAQLAVANLKDLDPEHTTIDYDAGGRFAGLSNKPPGVETAIAVPLMQSFVMTSEREYGNLYGLPRLANIEADYDRLVKSDKRDDKVSADDATRATIGRHPPGKTLDPTSGQELKNEDLIRKAMKVFASGGQVTLPNTRDDNSGNWLWDIDTRFNADELADKRQLRMDAKELRILRGLLVNDRVVIQKEVGAFSLVNKVWDIFRLGLEQVLREVEEHVDRYILARLDLLNYPPGTVPACHLRFDPLVDERIEMARGLLQTAFGQPDAKGLSLLAKMTNLAALFEAVKVPKGDQFDDVVEQLRELPIGPDSPLAGLDLAGMLGDET